MKQSHFSQLKKKWGLSDDTSLQELLTHARIKLDSDPENPELLFNLAEILRHTDKPDEAASYYKQAIKSTDERTRLRGEQLEHRVKAKRTHTRNKLLFSSLAPLLASVDCGFTFCGNQSANQNHCLPIAIPKNLPSPNGWRNSRWCKS